MGFYAGTAEKFNSVCRKALAVVLLIKKLCLELKAHQAVSILQFRGEMSALHVKQKSPDNSILLHDKAGY